MSSYGSYKENRFLLICFYLWVLSIPFYQFNIIGTLSVDNIIGPILVLIWLFTSMLGQSSPIRSQHLIWVMAVIFVYFLSTLLGFLLEGGEGGLFAIIWQRLKLILYLVLPILCIQTPQSFRVVLRLLVIDALIVSVAAILQSAGLIDLGFMRSQAGDRFGIAGFSRSPGILGNYGDLAIMLSLAFLATFGCWQTISIPKLNKSVFRYMVYCVLALGLFAGQSRNVALSIVVGITGFYFFSKLAKRKKVNMPMIMLVLFMLAVPVGLLAYFIFPYVYTLVLGDGGVKASVLDRFAQYELALSLFSENFLVGLGGGIHTNYSELMGYLHNFWLGIALTGGVFALISVAMLFYRVLTNAANLMVNTSMSKEAVVVAAATLSMLLASMFYVAQGSIIFWLILGVYLSLYTLAFVDNEKPDDKQQETDTHSKSSASSTRMVTLRS